MKIISIVISSLLLILLLLGQRIVKLEEVLAFTMSNDNWIIDFANLNMTSGKGTGTNYNVSNTVGQISPGLYTGIIK